MRLRRSRDVTLETGPVDLHIADGGGKYAPVLDEECLSGIFPHRHARRDRDAGAIEHPVGNLHAADILDIEAPATLEIDKAGLEPLLLIGGLELDGESWRLSDAQFVDRSGALIDELGEGP